MRVWVLIYEHCGDCGQVKGVFSSMDLAVAARNTQGWPDDCRIEEWEVSS